MELKKTGAKLLEAVKKYRYALLVLCIGLVLVRLPVWEEKEPGPQQQSREPSLQQQLTLLLSGVRGAGRVQVLLTASKGEQILYQTDDTRSWSDSDHSDRQDTVLVTDRDRRQHGLVRQVLPPEYQGALVLCQGADDPAVRLAITQAVSKVTGLGTDRIAVLKMK